MSGAGRAHGEPETGETSMMCQTFDSVFGLWIPRTSSLNHTQSIHSHCNVMEWLEQHSTERLSTIDVVFYIIPDCVLAKIREQPLMRPPARSSAYLRDDADCDVAASVPKMLVSATPLFRCRR